MRMESLDWYMNSPKKLCEAKSGKKEPPLENKLKSLKCFDAGQVAREPTIWSNLELIFKSKKFKLTYLSDMADVPLFYGIFIIAK